METKITVHALINAPVEKVWDAYTKPEHITKWNYASSDWHSPSAVNDLRPGGKFIFRMESKDGSQGFDFSGTYTAVTTHSLIAYTIDDDRKATVSFVNKDGKTEVTVTFEAEDKNTIELQQSGWQAILDNFKAYTEKGS